MLIGSAIEKLQVTQSLLSSCCPTNCLGFELIENYYTKTLNFRK